jgi:hypothetical protein
MSELTLDWMDEIEADELDEMVGVILAPEDLPIQRNVDLDFDIHNDDDGKEST